MDPKAQVGEEKRRWVRETADPATKRSPERRTSFSSTSGFEIDRLYTPAERKDDDYLRDVGFPGEYPFTRGVHPSMYRSRHWTMRQYAGFGDAKQSNARYRYLLQQGQTGLSVAFDLPTQMGYDADHPLAEGEVGKVGVAIDSLEDMETLLSDIPLADVSTSMTINAPAGILLAMYVAVAKRQGVELAKLRGTIQNDVLKEYVARGTYIYPPRASLRLATDIFSWCAEEVPRWNPISISGYHIREAGATAAQEIAFTLANGIAYVQAAIDAGIPIERFAPRISFFFNAQIDILEEVAKFRAARRMWARIVCERFGAADPSLGRMRFHAQTAGASLTAQQPEINIVRTAFEALAAVLGGGQSLHTNSMDEALGLPTEKAVTIALRTQQILAHETGVDVTADPLAGSYYVESMTDELESRAIQLIGKIDELGGAVPAIETGFQQRAIAESAYQWQHAVESGERIVVGVNRFVDEDEEAIPVHRVSDELRARQIERTGQVRQRRDDDAVRAALARVETCATGSENLMTAILAAVEALATVGEISERLADVYGRHGDTAF
ncbi:MAG: methylmalonyl-CoA mutase family protein [Acidobacteriota bacterium]|nr:methylmalonyl-CoA mutase family protein [Acidobacteriota bacterium]